MEAQKKIDSSSSSFTEKLFGSKESSDRSEIVNAIFSPKSKAKGKKTAKPEVADSNKSCVNESTKTNANTDDEVNGVENEKHVWGMDTLYKEQRMKQPCGLSSSLYYGGQDFYHLPEGSPTAFKAKNEATDDNSEGATRGDWWQGSLYY